MAATTTGQDATVPTRDTGRADIVGFGDAGVYVLRNNFSGAVHLAVQDFGYTAGGWRVENHLRLVADVTGDGLGDVVGFGNDFVFTAVNTNSAFQPVKSVIKDFAYNQGWRIEKHPRFLPDLRRTGRADILGFGDAGVLVALNNGGGAYGNTFLALNDLGYNAGGWRVDKHVRLLGDTNGDGYPDIVGFGDAHVFVCKNNLSGKFQPVVSVVDDFCYSAGGWRVEKHPRFIADLTGDGRVDIIGFGDAGVYTSLNNGNATFQPVKRVVDDLGYVAGGWRVEKHPRFIADLTGDRRGDIVGFGDAGVYACYNNGDGTFKPPKLVVADFGYVAGGWRVEKHPRFLSDLTGDGRADIIGFGDAGVYVAFNNGAGGFGPVKRIVDNFGYTAGGWRIEKHARYPANLYG